MKNRYDNLLRENNKAILDLVAYNPILFIMTAKEIEKVYKDGDRVLEIGTGEGDSAFPVFEHTKAHIDLLDISQEMLNIAKEKLSKFTTRAEYICEDANKYLEKASSYNIIFSGWTIHNFNHVDQLTLLRSIYESLTPEGYFFLMDKVYPDTGGEILLKKQNERYSRYLPEDVASAIIAHEIEDATDQYRLQEGVLMRMLGEIGFKEVKIIDRIERDVVIKAKK
ncbi:MAG TPA: class I SAM-dependent methyltransferase [Candidatus Paceibacterota bacterium]